MAKAPKKRVKQGTKLLFKQREINAIVNHAYYRVKFIGDCYHAPMALSIQKLWSHLTGESHHAGMNIFMRHLSREMDWGITLSCYFKTGDDLESLEVVQVIAVCQEFDMKTLGAALSDILIGMVNTVLEMDERLTLKNMIYYAYLLAPEFNATHLNLSDGLSDLTINIAKFEELKLFDDQLLGTVSHERTMFEAIDRNRVYPRVREVTYYPDPAQEILFHADTDFLIPTPVSDDTPA